MIVTKEANSIQRGGISGERVFGFTFSKKMYDLMSTNLYSDRIGSTVRETCSNAWDAHTAAKKSDVPFEVTLPTNLEPHFIVEDFGTGMPDDKAQDLYSTLGMSTKEQSNDMIGAFGLGSKVPFTVTDSFSVENTYEGMTYYYLCFKNEQGFPSILKTGEVATDRGNGVKVVIPVAGAKYAEFSAAMKRQLIMMDPKPIITNSDAFEFPESKRLYEFKNGFIIENVHDFKLVPRQVYAKMGIVLYPIDLGQTNIAYGTRYHENFGPNTCLVLNFDIGDLDPVPSREGLTYDSAGKTIDNIKDRYEAYRKELIENVMETINKETHTYTAWELVTAANKKLGMDISKIQPCVFNGYRYGSQIHSFPMFTIEEEVLEKKDDAGVVIQPYRKFKTTHHTYRYDSQAKSYYRKNPWRRDESISTVSFDLIKALVDGTIIYVLMDEKESKRKTVRIQHFAQSSAAAGKDVRYVNINALSSIEKDDFSAFCKVFDDFYPGLSAKFVRFSSIVAPIAPREKRDATTFKGVKIRQPGKVTCEMALDLELDEDTMFYITAERDTLTKYPQYKIADFMVLVGLSDSFSVIVVRKSGIKSIKALEDENIMEFSDFVADKLSGFQFSDKFKNANGAKIVYESVCESMAENQKQGLRMFHKAFNENGQKYYELLNEAKSLHLTPSTKNNQEVLVSFLRTNGMDVGLFPNADWHEEVKSNFLTKFNSVAAKFSEDYPLFMQTAKSLIGYPYNDQPLIRKYVKDMTELTALRSKVREVRVSEY